MKLQKKDATNQHDIPTSRHPQFAKPVMLPIASRQRLLELPFFWMVTNLIVTKKNLRDWRTNMENVSMIYEIFFLKAK